AAGILTSDEARIINDGLSTIQQRAASEPGYLDSREAEDVHSFVEAELVAIAGEAGYKLHTGRSRNDQVATDLRLFLRAEVDRTLGSLGALKHAILDLAERHREAVLPGYTHLQRAQPILFAHYLLAYFEMFQRDGERLADLRKRVNSLPLGAGALAGTGFPI